MAKKKKSKLEVAILFAAAVIAALAVLVASIEQFRNSVLNLFQTKRPADTTPASATSVSAPPMSAAPASATPSAASPVPSRVDRIHQFDIDIEPPCRLVSGDAEMGSADSGAKLHYEYHVVADENKTGLIATVSFRYEEWTRDLDHRQDTILANEKEFRAPNLVPAGVEIVVPATDASGSGDLPRLQGQTFGPVKMPDGGWASDVYAVYDGPTTNDANNASIKLKLKAHYLGPP